MEGSIEVMFKCDCSEILNPEKLNILIFFFFGEGLCNLLGVKFWSREERTAHCGVSGTFADS